MSEIRIMNPRAKNIELFINLQFHLAISKISIISKNIKCLNCTLESLQIYFLRLNCILKDQYNIAVLTF